MQSAPVLQTGPGANDYALVLSVARKAGDVSAPGASVRAGAFVQWLTARPGGGLPADHVHALISDADTVGNASLRQMLYELVPDLDERLASDGTVGRRCYLYVGGSAVGPPNDLWLIGRDTAGRLRVLDAAFQRFVEYLRATRIFDEVVAFADLLRLADVEAEAVQLPPVPPPLSLRLDGPATTFVGTSDPTESPPTGDTSDLVSYLGFTGALIEALTQSAHGANGAGSTASFVAYIGPRLEHWLGTSARMPRYEYNTTPPFVLFKRTTIPVATDSFARMPNAYALFIGIDDYVSIPPLSGCADDARALGFALASPATGGYDAANVRVLTDRAATRDTVIAEFARLASECDSESTVFVWFAGRAHVESGATTVFLADDRLDADVKGLTATQINAMLDTLRSRHVAVAFDTSGGGAGIYPRPGRVILSATLPEEDAYTGSSGTPGGDFTSAILRALNGAAAWDADDLSVFDVFEYAHAEVVRLGKQHPTIGMIWGEVGFPLAKAPLVPSVSSVIDADGYAYDVNVVHSLQSPRAGFVEHVLLPALRDAGLRIAVSAPLETSPVGRVVQIIRGMQRSRRTLLLDSRASSGDADFDDVVRLGIGSRPALADPRNLLIVALDRGVEHGSRREIETPGGELVLVETEPFDLISAQTAKHSSVRKLIERLKAPNDTAVAGEPQAGESAGTDVPLIEVTETGADSKPDVWLFSCDDSARVLEATTPVKSARRISLATRLRKGDVVLLRDPDDSRQIVGVSRVAAAFRFAAATVVTAGRLRRYDFELPIRLASPVDFVLSSFIAHALDPSGAEPSTRPSTEDAEILTGLCIASDTSVGERLTQWMGKTTSELVIPLGVAVLQRGTDTEQDYLLPSLISFLEGDAILDLWSKAREGLGRIDSGAVTRSLVARVERTAPGAPVLVEALSRSVDPAVRALQWLSLAANAGASPTSPGRSTSTGARPFKYPAFFDTTSEMTVRDAGVGRAAARNIAGAERSDVTMTGSIRRDRLLAVANQASAELRKWRAEPVDIRRPDRGTLARALRAMRESECIILSWSRETAVSPDWHELMIEALWITRQRAARFVAMSDAERPRTILTIVVDSLESLPPEIADQNWIDITHPENTLKRAAAEAVTFALATSQLLLENPDVPPPSVSLTEALDRIACESGDLLDADVDAIVNPIGSTANDTGQIGKQLNERVGASSRTTLGERDSFVAGETVLALSGGRIRARHIVHVCTVDSQKGHTADSVAIGALGAFRAAESLPGVRRIGYPALGSGDVGLDPLVVARAILPGIVECLTRGSSIERVTFVFRDSAALASYSRTLNELRSPPAVVAAPVVAGTRWYVSVRQTSIGTAYVGSNVSLGLFFSPEDSPNAISLLVPHSAFELTVYIDATAAFHLADASQQTVQVRDGWIDVQALPLRLLTLASGTHTVRVAVTARGALDAGSEVVVTCPITVEPPILLPNIPELIDRRTIPPPQPDVLLYVAMEPTAGGDRVRLHLTCRALGYERHQLDELLPLTSDDTAGIRFASAEVAGDLDASSPPDARAGLLAFGAALYDVLMPPAHELRLIVGRLLALPTRGDRPITWLVISDEAASLPWELVCPHGYAADATHWYDECLATRFVIAHWIGRRGFEMPNEAPIGPLGIVHYGQHTDAHPRWRAAIGAELASDADRHLGLDILKRGSAYFGVHLLRFSDATDAGRIAEATDARREGVAGESITRDRRLDFTLRRPIVSLSFVDAGLDHGAATAPRSTSIEQAWAAPFLLARASAVVGPRWTTSPSSDRVFYRAFYDAVRADRPLGFAVWEAREALRLAHPERADWLAYTYFGHPSCEPYAVADAEGFTLFEPMGMTRDQPFIAGREYLFRASFRGELPAWYNGRRHLRTTRLRGDGVRVLVAPLHGGDPATYELIAASGTDGGPDDDDYYMPVVLSMPNDAGTYKWFVQFTRGNEELRSTVITLDVAASETGEELIVHDPVLVESIPSEREGGVQRIADERSRDRRLNG